MPHKQFDKKDIQVLVYLCFSKDAPLDRNVQYSIQDENNKCIHDGENGNDFSNAPADKLAQAHYAIQSVLRLVEDEIARRQEQGKSTTRLPSRTRFDIARKQT